MKDFLTNSVFFGAVISLVAYEIGTLLKKKFKLAIFNPLLIAVICVMAVLILFHIDYDTYNEGGQYISYLLTPATVRNDHFRSRSESSFCRRHSA